jgi:hypothetical protein
VSFLYILPPFNVYPLKTSSKPDRGGSRFVIAKKVAGVKCTYVVLKRVLRPSLAVRGRDVRKEKKKL